MLKIKNIDFQFLGLKIFIEQLAFLKAILPKEPHLLRGLFTSFLKPITNEDYRQFELSQLNPGSPLVYSTVHLHGEEKETKDALNGWFI